MCVCVNAYIFLSVSLSSLSTLSLSLSLYHSSLLSIFFIYCHFVSTSIKPTYLPTCQPLFNFKSLSLSSLVYSYLSIYLSILIFISPFLFQRNSIYLSIFTNPFARAGYDTRSIFKRSLTGLNSEFSFS